MPRARQHCPLHALQREVRCRQAGKLALHHAPLLTALFLQIAPPTGANGAARGGWREIQVLQRGPRGVARAMRLRCPSNCPLAGWILSFSEGISEKFGPGMNYQTGERGGAFSPVRALLFNMASSRMTRVDKLSASEKNQRTGRRGEITRRWGICCPKKKGTSSFYFRTVKSALPYGL